MDMIEADDDELERRDREARLNTMRNSGIWTRSRDATPTKPPAPAGTPRTKASPSQSPPPSQKEVASAAETSAIGDGSGPPATNGGDAAATIQVSDTDQSGSDHSISSFDDDYDDGDVEEPDDVPEPRERREPSIVGADSGITEALLQADNYDISELKGKYDDNEGPAAAAAAVAVAAAIPEAVAATTASSQADDAAARPAHSHSTLTTGPHAEDHDVTAAFPLTPRGRKFLEKLMRDPTLIADSLSRSPAVSPMRRTASLARQGDSFRSSSERIEAASSPRRRQSHSAPPAVREAGAEEGGAALPPHHGPEDIAAAGGDAAGENDGADNDSSRVDEFDSDDSDDSDEEAKTASSTAKPAPASSSASSSAAAGEGERAQTSSNPASASAPAAPSRATNSNNKSLAFAGRRSQMPPGTYSRIFSTSVAGSFILEETPLRTFIVGAVLERAVAAKVDIGDLLVSCSGQVIEDHMTLADVTAMLDQQARCYCCYRRC
jgi:hypothetical protein